MAGTNTLNEIGIYKLLLIFKNALSIIFIIVPIIVMFIAIKDLFNLMIHPDNPSTTIKDITSKIVSGLIIFLLPTIINYAFTLIESYNPETVIKYYNEASNEKIASLEKQYEQERKADQARSQAEQKEALLKRKQEEQKRNENLEQNTRPEPTPSTPYTGDTTSGGSFGSVTVSNGVFTIPNRRATSDADIPKQSGPYGLNPIFAERLTKLMQDASAKGYKITVTSGWRSYSSQRRLWDQSTRPCSERSKWTACPGGSRHGFGIAADLSFNGSSCSGNWDCNSAAKWVHDNASQYGLTFRMSWEPWHIEPAQVVGGSFGSCTATC